MVSFVRSNLGHLPGHRQAIFFFCDIYFFVDATFVILSPFIEKPKFELPEDWWSLQLEKVKEQTEGEQANK